MYKIYLGDQQVCVWWWGQGKVMGDGNRLTGFTLFWDGKYLGRALGTETSEDRCRVPNSSSRLAWDHTLTIHTAVAISSLQLLAYHGQKNSKTFLEPSPSWGQRNEKQKPLFLKESIALRWFEPNQGLSCTAKSPPQGYIQESCEVN